jgi:hypothetical protein
MWLDGLVPTGVTAVSLVVLLYFSQLRGWIYFKPQVEEIRKDRDTRLAEVRADRDSRVAEAREDRDARVADKERENQSLWEALNLSESGRRTVVAQNERLLDGLETTAAVVRAIPTPTNHTGA